MFASIFLIILLTIILFISLWMIFSFLRFHSLFVHLEILSNKKKNNETNLNRTNIQDFSHQNSIFQEKNDIEKAIIKNNQIVDISTFPAHQILKINESFPNEEFFKLERIMKEFFISESNKIDISQDNYNDYIGISEGRLLCKLIKKRINTENCIISLYNTDSCNTSLKKPFIYLNVFNLLLDLLIRILILSAFSQEITKIVSILFTIPVISYLPLNLLKLISMKLLNKMISENNLQISFKIGYFILFYIQMNLFYILMFLCFMISIINEAFSLENVIIMLIPSILIDYLFMKNVLIIVFNVISCIYLKKFKSESYQEQLKKENSTHVEKCFNRVIKEFRINEDLSAPSQIISENLSKFYNERKINQTYNNSISVFPQIIEENPILEGKENQKDSSFSRISPFKNLEEKNNEETMINNRENKEIEFLYSSPQKNTKKTQQKTNEIIYSEKLQCKMVNKFHYLNAKCPSERNSKPQKILSERKDPKEKYLIFNKENLLFENKNQMKKSISKTMFLKNFFKNTFTSEKKSSNILNIFQKQEFHSSKKRNSLLEPKVLFNENFENIEFRNSDKNEDFEISQKIENFKIKEEKNNLTTSADHSELLDYNKENLRIQENSIHIEKTFLEKIYMERNKLKTLIASNYENENPKTSSKKKLEKNNFIEEITLFDLKKKEKERKKMYRTKDFRK